MQTALEPFMQPGVQETYKNILLSTLLSLLALAKGNVLAPKNHTEERKIHRVKCPEWAICQVCSTSRMLTHRLAPASQSYRNI